jgi:hypothetical protein
MKRTILTSVLLVIAVGASFAQDQEFEYYKPNEIKTLLGSNRSGGKYGSISLGYSIIDNKQTLIFSERINWLPSHSFGIGMGATEFINENDYNSTLERDAFLVGGYGGFYLEPILLPKFPVHLSFPALFGAGGLSYYSNDGNWDNSLFDDFKVFLIIEPGAEIELNLTKSVRLAAGFSYRFTTPFATNSSENYATEIESLRSLTFKLTFKFGKF